MARVKGESLVDHHGGKERIQHYGADRVDLAQNDWAVLVEY
jgi:hypothetical protein